MPSWHGLGECGCGVGGQAPHPRELAADMRWGWGPGKCVRKGLPQQEAPPAGCPGGSPASSLQPENILCPVPRGWQVAVLRLSQAGGRERLLRGLSLPPPERACSLSSLVSLLVTHARSSRRQQPVGTHPLSLSHC